jgi:hypothetical protein
MLHEISTASINRLSAPVSARSLLPKSFNAESSTLSTQKMHTYEVRPRKDHRGVNLISDALPFGRLWASQTQPAMQSVTRSFTAAHMVL